jgi:hypothetical protein
MVWQVMTIKAFRTLVGICVGASILLHETFLVAEAEPFLLLTGLACLAGTFALSADESRRGGKE